MEPARLLRSVFGVPIHEPTYAAGVTIEKLVMIDGPKAPLYRVVCKSSQKKGLPSHTC